ncbi:MAG: WD40 repeat domain-containing protein, partial [Lachnospiraceae bacterium]|nr:WD40 repeat domain-containing protein [Lachnospiraceae bacterium]
DDDDDDEIDESDAHFNDTRLYIPEAEYALSNFLYAYSCGNELGVDRSMSHDMPVLMMEARRDGQYVVTVDSVGATYLWESAYGSNLLKIDADMNTDGSRIVPKAVALDDEFIYIVVDGTIKKYDYNGGLVYQRDIDMAAKSARIYPEESYAFVVSDYGVAIVDIATGESALYYSESDIRFDGYMDYSEDSHYFVASHSERFGDTVELTVINTDNLSTVNTYVYEGQQVKLVDVQTDGKAVFMIDLDCDAEITGSIKTRLMCVDCRDGSELWRNEAVYAYNVGKSRITSIDNAVSFSGINRKVVTVAVGRNLTTYKFDTGEMMSTGILQDEIVDIWSSNVQGYVVAVQSNGRVDIVRCETGAVYEPGTVELDVPVSGWWSGGGLCLVQNEKDVVIMRYHTASDLETIVSDAGANFAKLSTAEDYIVNYGYTGDFSFYRTDGEFIRTIVINGARTERFSSFTFDNYFVTLSIEDNQPVCNWYEPTSDDLHKYTLFGNVIDADKTVREVIYNRSHTYAVYVCDYCYSVVDLTNRVEVYSGTTEEIITGAAVSENGAYLYLAFADAPFCDINLSTLDITRYPELALNCGSIGNNNIIVSDDGWYVAVCCKDAFIRTADLFEEYVTTELEIFSTDNFSMVFMPMLKDVLVCYNSEDVCVIDAEYGYISEHISMELEGVESLKYDEELHYYAVVLENGVTLMDELTNKPVAFVPNAFGYISSTHTFLVKNNSDIYTTKYKNYEELIDEAHRQFPDAELTEEEKIKYNII